MLVGMKFDANFYGTWLGGGFKYLFTHTWGNDPI